MFGIFSLNWDRHKFNLQVLFLNVNMVLPYTHITVNGVSVFCYVDTKNVLLIIPYAHLCDVVECRLFSVVCIAVSSSRVFESGCRVESIKPKGMKFENNIYLLEFALFNTWNIYAQLFSIERNLTILRALLDSYFLYCSFL